MTDILVYGALWEDSYIPSGANQGFPLKQGKLSKKKDIKKSVLIFVIILAVIILTAICICLYLKNNTCVFGHQWIETTCENPSICTKCGSSEGKPLGHEWIAATCEKRETCNVCGKTQGDFPRHTARQGYCGNCGLYVNELEDTYNSLVDTITVTWLIPLQTVLSVWQKRKNN